MIRYSDVYVQTIARGLCQPGEQFVAAGAAHYQSFWTFNIPYFRHNYLLIATSERLIVADHRRGLIFDRMDAVQSFPWSQVSNMKIGGIFTKKLTIKDQTNRAVLSAKLPKMLMNPLKGNSQSIKQVVSTWEQRRALGAGQQAAGSLPPASYNPQFAPALGAPTQQQPFN
ncbi:MAG: hypothetical protein ACRELY_15675 [Polyangiaceae bacterium]